ncbi:hypothetical protein AYI70_g3255 [Smittium culicis]|uniref:PiggyBac transposable element-derived protein 4 C-terminal zinc-ribbon domain-containing protein n=1 Tax=Smittium culicis TaxID=133412 RepID=A0A1R1WZL9_9FUNG|nr:hypothetical protein AYI70_g11929 [Smittium culicis]OMJ19054.1 hypothetical protein AYI70_g4969 [Smittium culicis]OMJ21800.1 hypothetical protein AYI70_g3255 [Smittium culicis]
MSETPDLDSTLEANNTISDKSLDTKNTTFDKTQGDKDKISENFFQKDALDHFPQRLLKKKRCKYCYNVLKVRRETLCECSKCKVPLCVYTCFRMYHQPSQPLSSSQLSN